jgi:1,4-dihydroxy-6-naphthoate synthase
VLIRLGHSPDPDDAFMFWALAEGRVETRGFEFELVHAEIGTLNEWAREGRLEVTGISLGAYPMVSDRYLMLPHGASIGSGYGPVVVAREPMTLEQLRGVEVAIPGHTTTSFLVLRLALGDCAYREVPFEKIIDEVRSGRAEAGIVIHEGQLTYATAGLKKVVDLGEWWLLETGLPLPLGVNVARRDLGDALPELSEVLISSIRAGMNDRREALEYALLFGRGLDEALADRFVDMYVNDYTCDFGEEGREAVRELLRRGHEVGLVEQVEVEFAP